MTAPYALILFLTVLALYSLKALRLYFLISGEGVAFLKFLSAFSFTTLLNILVPFKVCELFRFFCFGHLMKKYLKGFSVVLLDRFVDIVSLLLTFMIMKFLDGTEFSWIFYLLLSLCIFLIMFYLALQNLLVYWNEYFLKASPSTWHLSALAFLKKVSTVYSEIKTLISGRFFAILTLSVFSWGIEIASLVLCKEFFSVGSKNLVSNYLSAALTGERFEPLYNFIQMSAVFLLGIFTISTLALVLAEVFDRLVRRQKCGNAKIRGNVKNGK